MAPLTDATKRHAPRIAAFAVLLAIVSCQSASNTSDDGFAQLEGPDRAEGRELNAIDMSREMDDMSDARYDAAEAEIEGGG